MSDNAVDAKSAKILELTQDAVSRLLLINEDTSGPVVVSQCRRVAIEIGNALAPQLYGSRVHGVGNAVSFVIRHCAEALFWLDMAEQKSQETIDAVIALREFLSSPQLS